MEENKETLDLGFAKLDLQRQQRCGFPEVVYCAGKTVDQSVRILDILMEKYDNVIGTRADKAVYDALAGRHPAAQYDELARMVYQHKDKTVVNGDRLISVITAGTSDIPIAEEAASSTNRSSPCRPVSDMVPISTACRPSWPCSTAVLPAYPSSTSTTASALAAWPIR